MQFQACTVDRCNHIMYMHFDTFPTESMWFLNFKYMCKQCTCVKRLSLFSFYEPGYEAKYTGTLRNLKMHNKVEHYTSLPQLV